jgi:hypothetical protein
MSQINGLIKAEHESLSKLNKHYIIITNFKLHKRQKVVTFMP